MIINRYFVTSSAEGKYIDERFFTSFRDAVIFAAGIITALSSESAGDVQLLIINRNTKRIEEFFLTSSDGVQADISPRIQKLIDRKFRRKTPDISLKEMGKEINELNIVKSN